jgi:hypothetical protein
LLSRQPQAVFPLEPQAVVSATGVCLVTQDVAAKTVPRHALSWDEMTQVDVLTVPTAVPSDSLCFVLMAGPERDRCLLVPGAQAVSTDLLSAMAGHLGVLNQSQLMRAISCQGEGRFTLWQRPAQG